MSRRAWWAPLVAIVCAATAAARWGRRQARYDMAPDAQRRDRVSGALLVDALDDIANDWIKYACGDGQPGAKRVDRHAAPPRAAMFLINVDRFPELQAMLTVAEAERFLLEAVQRMQRLGAPVGGYCARTGHDQFRLFVPNMDDQAAQHLAARLRDDLNEPYFLDGTPLMATFSVAAALYPDHGEQASALTRAAHVALKEVRLTERGGWRVFDQTTLTTERQSRELEQDLRHLILTRDMSSFELLFQPIVRCADTQCIGGEALLRWRHTARGMVPTDELIHLAERTGLIVPLGSWVLEQACQQAMAWPAHWRLHVNISVEQMDDPDLPQQVAQVLARTGLAPERLGLELTETIIIRHYAQHAATLAAIRATGVSIVLDDFGTGYSSLNHLRRLPLDWIKLDAGFMNDLDHDPGARAVVAALVDLSRALDLVLVAEGVESDAQRRVLCEMGCDTMQGYLLGRPMPSAAMMRHTPMS